MDSTMIIVMVVLLMFMLVMPYFTQRKRNREYLSMLESIKVGDLVKTAGGIIGKVNKITDKGDFKTIVLETGSKSNKSFIEMDMTMIYCVLTKTSKPNEQPKENIEVLEKIEEAEKVENETVETENVEKTEEKAEEKPKRTRKSTAKTTAKKSSAKKTTKKSSK